MIGLGRMLEEARTARGAALEQVERETRISKRYLVALEAEEFGSFPAQGQARGFLRLYAQYLGLDPAEMLALYPQDGPIDEADGLVHADRIFRETARAPGLELPSVDPRHPGLQVAALVVAVIVATALLSSVCASGRERANVGLLLLAQNQGASAARVPDVRDQELTVALAALARVGIAPLVIEVTADRVQAGVVLRQYPPPDSIVPSATDVTLIVSRGR